MEKAKQERQQKVVQAEGESKAAKLVGCHEIIGCIGGNDCVMVIFGGDDDDDSSLVMIALLWMLVLVATLCLFCSYG